MCVSFVCVKQKTAYEMRISDWSSDVCSSDLDTDRAEEQHRPFDPVETDDRAQDVKAVTIGGELRFRTLDPREIGRVDFGDGHLEFERMDADLGFDLETGRQHRKALDEPPRKHAIAGRSDEHTSELQSLL